MHVVDYLDVTLNLNDGSFKPFRKPVDDTNYTHTHAQEMQYHHVASGGLKTCGICSVLYVCVSSCNLSPRSDYNRFVLLGLYRP